MNKKETEEFQRDRAKMEFELTVYQVMHNFKSKEEPTVKLTEAEMFAALSKMLSKYLNR